MLNYKRDICRTRSEERKAKTKKFTKERFNEPPKKQKHPSLGQAALLIHRPSTFSAPDGPPFWAAIPAHPAVYWPVLALTVAASIVASQALISAAFAIVKQCQCGFMPRLQVVHTSKHHEGQIYIPAINWVRECSGLQRDFLDAKSSKEEEEEEEEEKLTSFLSLKKKKKTVSL